MLEIITKALVTLVVLGTVTSALGAVFDRESVERAGLAAALCGVLAGILVALAYVWAL